MKYFILLISLVLGPWARAGFLLDVSGTYLADDLTSSSSHSSSKMYYGLGALFTLNKNFWGGWSYSGITHSDTTTVTNEFSTSDTGPTVKWQLGKSDTYSLGATFNILSSATYTSGTTAEKWKGTSYLLQFSAMPEVGEKFHVGVSLNYYSASYTQKTVANVESSASITKTWIFPTISLNKEW